LMTVIMLTVVLVLVVVAVIMVAVVLVTVLVVAVVVVAVVVVAAVLVAGGGRVLLAGHHPSMTRKTRCSISTAASRARLRTTRSCGPGRIIGSWATTGKGWKYRRRPDG
jgi:hypothetical protein